jgi:hypothetical protein
MQIKYAFLAVGAALSTIGANDYYHITAGNVPYSSVYWW